MATEAPTQAQLASQMSDLMTRWRTYTDQLQAWLGGTVTGGPNADGMYPMTDHLGNTFLIPCPALEAARVDGMVNSASSFSDAAQASADAAMTYLTNAGLARDAASEFADAAKAARDLAKIYADQAGSNASNALAYSQQAAASAAAAAATIGDLNAAVTNAQGSADAALASEQAAAASESAAAGSAADANASAAKAQTFEPNNYALRVDPVIINAMEIHPQSSTSDPVLRFRDYNSVTRGALYWSKINDNMVWAKNRSDGTIAGYCQMLSDGSFWNQYGGYFGGTITTDGSLDVRNAQAYIAHQYPLVEFRKSGAPISEGEGFVGSWNGGTFLRSWPSAKDHTNYLEVGVNCTTGKFSMSTGIAGALEPFYMTTTGGMQVQGTGASYNIRARDGGQTWSTYATGNQYRVWANTVGDLFTIGISGDAYIKNNNGGGSLQLGDDTKLIDVNLNHTLGIQSLANPAAGFLKFGNAGARVGWDTAGLYADGTHTSGLGTTSAGYIWHTGNLGTGPWYGNMNQCLKSGFYRMGDGSNSTNLPGGGSYGQMIVSSGGGGDTTAQLLLGYNSDRSSGGKMYWRGIHGNGAYPHAWRTVWDDDNLIISSGDPGYIEGRIWIQI